MLSLNVGALAPSMVYLIISPRIKVENVRYVSAFSRLHRGTSPESVSLWGG